MMEKYLKEEYNVFEDENWLTSEDQIEEFFREDSGDYFDCGQGYYNDKANVTCKIGDKFYRVNIEAEIESSKQEYGDRLYRYAGVSNVSYKEIDKPQPRERVQISYNLDITKQQKSHLEYFMKENNIEFK